MYRERLARAEMDQDTDNHLAGMYWSTCRENARLMAENARLKFENGCLRQTVVYYRQKPRSRAQRPDMAQWAVFWSVAGVAAYVGVMALAIWIIGR